LIVSKQSKELRKHLNVLCSYAKASSQYSEINVIIDNLRNNILCRVEQLENTLALSKIFDETLFGELEDKIERLAIDTYDEEGNQD
jgi:hypothetical protein